MSTETPASTNEHPAGAREWLTKRELHGLTGRFFTKLATPMKFAYADPPYLGCGKLYAKSHADALKWDSPAAHEGLIAELCDQYPDGWAMSASSPSLRIILPMCPDDVRVMAWVKPFAVFKPNVGVAYAWEPVIVRGGRKRTREQDTVRDWCSANITLRKGVSGAKPPTFVYWLLAVLGAEPADEIVDLFPGSGMVADAIERWRGQQRVFA